MSARLKFSLAMYAIAAMASCASVFLSYGLEYGLLAVAAAAAVPAYLALVEEIL